MVETVKSIVEKLNVFYKQMDEEVTEEKELLNKEGLNDISHRILNNTLNMIIRNYELYKANYEFITEDKYYKNKIDDLYYVREKLGGEEIIKRKKSICLYFNKYMYDTVYDIFKSVIPTNSDITLKKSDFAIGINTQSIIFDILTKISCEEERTSEDSFSHIGSLLYNLIDKKGTIKINIYDTKIENTLEDTFDFIHVNVKQKEYNMSYIPVEEY
ncbi:hypothetical protein POVCU1_056800 [Plasmodium ovale curtisi]|uniref:Uncharacterized protein n=1 Tax=Plasmodium ovale curtisi TaxID=864141 RepID=A0A1A8X5X5_PLAOA|nr:hypothetical protein POVCU1_056800 [Plasmodium ovale curtisi]